MELVMANGTKKKRLLPTGECWCGCGEEVPVRSFFRPGHDKRAEAAVATVVYGGIANMLEAHGFGPGKRNPVRELEAYRAGKAAGAE